MTTYVFKGEDFLTALGLERAEAKEFQGVAVYRFWGTKTQIAGATKMLTEAYPDDLKTTLGDAIWLGTIRAPLPPGERPVYEDFFELIVMRKVGNENR